MFAAEKVLSLHPAFCPASFVKKDGETGKVVLAAKRDRMDEMSERAHQMQVS